MKKGRIFLIFVLTIACATSNLEASWEDITFTGNGIIQDGDKYIRVFVHGASPDPTTIEMSGGEVGTLFIHDHSVVNITGGIFDRDFYLFHPENRDCDDLFLCPGGFCVYVYDHSTVNVSGGLVDGIKCEDWGTVNISGGNFNVAFSDHATVYITDGRVMLVAWREFTPPWGQEYEDNSHLYLLGGQILGGVLLEDNATMEIYGYGFTYDPNGGDPDNPKFSNGGRLTGFWWDGTAFSIDFQDFRNHSYDNVILHEIHKVDIAVIRIEQAIAEKKEALGRVDAALEKEWDAYDAFEELLEGGDQGDLKKGDIVKAKQKIHSAIQHEEQSKEALEKSIEKLEDALVALGQEVAVDEPVEE